MLYTVGPSYGSENKNNTMNFEYALSFVLATNYHIVASTSLSRFEAHAGLFRLLMKVIFDAYVPQIVYPVANTQYLYG